MSNINAQSMACLQAIVDALKTTGGSLSATTLKRYHGCDSPFFDEAAKYGCDKKIIIWQNRNFYKLIKPDWVIPEREYYATCIAEIRKLWIDMKFDAGEYFVELTAHSDSKISGRWTRPDLTLVSFKKFPWTIGNEFDVVTFEVKRPDSSDVLAVFEALSHSSAATKSYVVFTIEKKKWLKANQAQADRVLEECRRLGVGLIFVEDPFGQPTVRHEIPAERREIDHSKCSSFLEAVMSSDAKNRIAAWK
jgi:hypothetical protein